MTCMLCICMVVDCGTSPLASTAYTSTKSLTVIYAGPI